MHVTVNATVRVVNALPNCRFCACCAMTLMRRPKRPLAHAKVEGHPGTRLQHASGSGFGSWAGHACPTSFDLRASRSVFDPYQGHNQLIQAVWDEGRSRKVRQ